MRPIELYRFVQGATVTTFTSGDKAVTYLAEVYEPIPIGRSNIEMKNELSKANIDVTIDINNDIARGWMNTISEDTLFLTIFQQSDIVTGVIWKGRLANIRPQVAHIKFVFESIFTSLRRPGLRARFQRNCRFPLYGRGCGLNKDDFDVTRSATAVDATGTIITIPTAAVDPAGDYFTGMLKYDNILRFVTAHSGASLTISRPIKSLITAVGLGPTNVILYPGCDRSRTRCFARFNNLAANGSFPFIPIRSPMDGSSIE